jgi:hypothetical protein
MPLGWPPQVPDPWSKPDSWDSIAFNGTIWGKGTATGGGIEVKGASRFYKIDQKDAKGQDGSTQTYVGSHPKPFRLVFKIWTSVQWIYWNTFILKFFYYSGVINKVVPIAIDHPATSVLGITAVLAEDIGAPEIDDLTKMATQIITVREYLPAVLGNASVTPVGPPPPPPTSFATAPYNAKIAQNQAIIQQLQNQLNSEPSTLPK